MTVDADTAQLDEGILLRLRLRLRLGLERRLTDQLSVESIDHNV